MRYVQTEALTWVTSDLRRCLALLDDMSHSWVSARHCHAALETLLNRLASRPNVLQPTLPLGTVPAAPSLNLKHTTMPPSPSHSAQQGALNECRVDSNHKRRRTDGSIESYVPALPHGHAGVLGYQETVVGPWSGLQDWQPVLEYTGPDFGFDADQFSNGGEWQAAAVPNLDAPSGTLFSNAGFEAYVQTFGDRLNF